jgi:hypothetical protein
MLCFLTHRRLKPGSYDEFRKAWEPEEPPADLPERIFHVRSLDNPDEIISFGIADVDVSQLAELRERLGGTDAEERRQARMAPYVEWTGVDGIFEVVEEIHPGQTPAARP